MTQISTTEKHVLDDLMTHSGPDKMANISVALTQLELLGEDEYFIAFGPSGRQFCGTPNGYSAERIPPKVVTDLTSGQIKKVVWASFGSHPSSYYFGYQRRDGTSSYRAGSNIPKALRQLLDVAYSSSSGIAESIRVQLGVNNSYVIWANSHWACHRVPSPLRDALCHLSSNYNGDDDLKGTLKIGKLTNVAWHDNGSYYIKSHKHTWSFQSSIIQQVWNDLWQGLKAAQCERPELAYVAIDPHSATGDTFAFILKKQNGRHPDFAIRFEPEKAVLRLPQPSAANVSGTESIEDPREGDIINIAKHPRCPQAYQWAFSKYAGRPHPKDAWELVLKKGERLKILQDMGRDWYIAEKHGGIKGYVHDSWLDFRDLRKHVDPQEAYACWTADTAKLLQGGPLRFFPDPSRYMDACAKEECKSMKQDSHGLTICVHDLHELMRGSGQYTLENLKAQRNRYHPDKFARFCHPDNRAELKAKAQALFVLFGVLMDWLENPLDDAKDD